MTELQQVKEASAFILKQTKLRPKISLTLGSGLGNFVDAIEKDIVIPFSEIPHFQSPGVEGHGGKLIVGHAEEKEVFVFQGRIHYYEGHSLNDVVLPTRTIINAGAETLVLTNSAGGILDEMSPADLMIINDHINFSGHNPLIGPNTEEFGPRFPDMSHVYDSDLNKQMEEAFKKVNVPHHTGIYCWMSGPSYETPAEIQMLKKMGVGAAGMSTVPEAIVARHMGAKVCGVSCITNLAAGISPDELSHDEVTENAGKASKNFSRFLSCFIGNLS